MNPGTGAAGQQGKGFTIASTSRLDRHDKHVASGAVLEPVTFQAAAYLKQS